MQDKATPPKFKTVLVKFQDQKHNYKTAVSGKCTDEELKQYFVNVVFNVGRYPIELMKRCTSIEILKYQE